MLAAVIDAANVLLAHAHAAEQRGLDGVYVALKGLYLAMNDSAILQHQSRRGHGVRDVQRCRHDQENAADAAEEMNAHCNQPDTTPCKPT